MLYFILEDSRCDMLDNKILINLYILSLSTNYEVFIPVNEKVGNITKLLNTTMFDSINFDKNNIFVNIETGTLYKNNDLIRNTDIKNGTKIILI